MQGGLPACQRDEFGYVWGAMSTLEMTVEELKSLPPAKLEAAAGYIHRLKLANTKPQRGALERSFGCLTAAEGEKLDQGLPPTAKGLMPAIGDVLLDTSVIPFLKGASGRNWPRRARLSRKTTSGLLRWRWNTNCRWLLAMLFLTSSLGWQCLSGEGGGMDRR